MRIVSAESGAKLLGDLGPTTSPKRAAPALGWRPITSHARPPLSPPLPRSSARRPSNVARARDYSSVIAFTHSLRGWLRFSQLLHYPLKHLTGY